MRFFPAALLGGVLLVLPLATSAAQNAAPETTPVPVPSKPDFSTMQFMTGTWTCSVKSSRRPAAFQTTSTASMSPDGYWLITKTTTHKASWIPRETSNTDWVTYDASTSRWVDIGMGTAGSYNVSTSPGWQGNSIVWTDALIQKTNATASTNPSTMTKAGNTKTTTKQSFTEPGGRVVNVVTTCTKSG